jgi:DNA modification methylase
VSVRLLIGDALEQLRTLPPASVQTCITSPPYFGLRSYLPDDHPDKAREIGLEETPTDYVNRLVTVFREVKRVLRSDGTAWIVIGDSYASGMRSTYDDDRHKYRTARAHNHRPPTPQGVKAKDLIGIPWRLAFALRDDGWYLRSDIVWFKPNAFPESVKDRPTRSHEYVFLLSKTPRYYYNAAAIKEPAVATTWHDYTGMPYAAPGQSPQTGSRHKTDKQAQVGKTTYTGLNASQRGKHVLTRNKRDVWSIPTQPYPHAHFATFPEALVEPMILAGSRPGDTVLDPFAGSGTTLAVAARLGRDAIGIELNPAYQSLIVDRLRELRVAQADWIWEG